MHNNFLPINKVLYYLILSLILAKHKNSKASHDQAETATVASIKRSFNSRISLHCLKAEPILLNSSFLSPAAILGSVCVCTTCTGALEEVLVGECSQGVASETALVLEPREQQIYALQLPSEQAGPGSRLVEDKYTLLR